MLRIGLTGGIGSGKSIVADNFKQLGVPVIDADSIAHQITAPGSECLSEISKRLGPGFITPDHKLDRKKLADYVFSHPDKKNILENILHPRIRQRMLHEAESLEHADYVILVVPLLFETDFIELVDRVLVVAAPEATRIRRIRVRDGRSEEQIRFILKSQLDQSVKTDKADDVLDNSGNLEQLRTLVEALHHKYLRMSSGITAG